MLKPIVSEAFADNGEHSHWRLINPETGELLWTECPEEDKILYSQVPRRQKHLWGGGMFGAEGWEQ
jgi:hypothetical protein